jgi:hypothetical protein
MDMQLPANELGDLVIRCLEHILVGGFAQGGLGHI